MTFLYIIAKTVDVLLMVIYLAMFVRVLLSWIMPEEGFLADLENFATMLTEPVIAPVRLLMSPIKNIDSLPIDIPFFVTFLLLGVVRAFLPIV